MAALYQAAFTALADRTTVSEIHKTRFWEQFHDTLQGKLQHKKGPVSCCCLKKELCKLDHGTEEDASFSFK